MPLLRTIQGRTGLILPASKGLCVRARMQERASNLQLSYLCKISTPESLSLITAVTSTRKDPSSLGTRIKNIKMKKPPQYFASEMHQSNTALAVAAVHCRFPPTSPHWHPSSSSSI
jgi:hypothetical protein